MGLAVCLLTGCGNSGALTRAYDVDNAPSAYRVGEVAASNNAKGFAADICVTATDVKLSDGGEISVAESAGLFDTKDAEVKYAKNVHEKLNPASLTKIMTALVAIKYGELDDTITASANVQINESGAQLAGLKQGDRLTLEQALHALLMFSGNDAAVAIAEHIGGSIDEFVNMMNQEALKLGATNTHFVNPHGLTDPEHYSTAYDLYLIFNEVMKYEKFTEIIHMATYTTTYTDSKGKSKDATWNNTNLFLKEGSGYSAPENVVVIGGKTGTTAAAGACLILLSKDTSGSPFVSVILKSDGKDNLYQEMIKLLTEINK